MELRVLKSTSKQSLLGSDAAIIKDAINGDSLIVQQQSTCYCIKLADIMKLISDQETEAHKDNLDNVNG